MSSTRLVLVRHAQTAMNGGSPDPILCGWADPPLTVLGERQAATLESCVSADAVYSSTLQRARATAVHCCGGADIHYELGLREIGCGEVDGMLLRDVQRRYPDVWARNVSEADDRFRWPGGESYVGFRGRVIATIAAIAARHRGAAVAIVTHAGVITQLLGHIAGHRPAQWSSFRVGNASITEVDWQNGHGIVRAFDRREHLPVELRT